MLVTLVSGGGEPPEGVECPQLGLVLVTPGFMVRESEGHPAPATKFRVVSVDAVERERFEGVVEELLPTCLLAPGRLKQDHIPESVQHQILDSDTQSQHSLATSRYASAQRVVALNVRTIAESEAAAAARPPGGELLCSCVARIYTIVQLFLKLIGRLYRDCVLSKECLASDRTALMML